MHLRLATYNIHACIGLDGHFAPERTARVLRELDVDLLALQEVEHHPVDHSDLLDYLAARSGLRAITGPTLLRGDRHYGNALLTRLPVLRSHPVDLSLPGREPRGALDVHLDWMGRDLQSIATHLGLRPGERRDQIRRLLRLVTPLQADLALLMGDLNEWLLWGRPLRWLHARFSPGPHRATYPSCWPVLALDRIWTTPGWRLSQLRPHRSPLARRASDHLPLRAVLHGEPWPAAGAQRS